MECPYCGLSAEFISSKKFYGEDFGTNLYVCWECDARVGTHGKGKMPLGTMANKQLRELRKTCHQQFDQKWKGRKKFMSRNSAYKWLQEKMKLPPREAHIAMFDEEKCFKLLRVLQEEKREIKARQELKRKKRQIKNHP